jgi:hypothetical protein
MNVIIEKSGEIISEAQLSAIESKLGVKLPQEYRSFILESNGGVPSPSGFSTEDGKVESYVSQFYIFGGSIEDDFETCFNFYTKGGLIPPNLVAVAKDPVDNQVLLGVSGDDYGKLFYWSADEEDDEHDPSFDYMRLVATDFLKFLGKLRD